MKKFTKGLAAGAVAAALTLPMVSHATNGILPLGNGMVAHGFGGAGIANGAETMSGVDNPALVSRTSKQWNVGASLFSPMRSGDFGGGYVDSDSNYFLIPQGGVTLNLSSSWDMGILVTALGGMNTDYDASKINPGLTGRAGMNLSGLLVSVPFSVKLAPKHSIAIAPLLGYEMMETKLPAGFFGPVDMGGSDSATGYGVKVGYVGDVAPGVALGFTYQSKIKMGEMSKFCDADGGTNPSAIFAGLKQTGRDCSLDMPEQYGIGIAWDINPSWKVVGDILQVNWSSVDVFGTNPALGVGGFGWQDQTIYKIGAQVQATPSIAVRFGYNYAKSPIKNEDVSANLLAPAVTEQHFTFGIGQKLSNSELNYYLAYIPEKEQVGTSYSTGTKAKMWQWALGVGYNAHF